MSSTSTQYRPRRIWPRIVALILILLGLPLVIGGVQLITLGGSWYYAVAGTLLVLAGGLIWAGRMSGVWIYALTFLGTLAWAFWESGLDGWALVPRLIGPLIIGLLVAVPPTWKPLARNTIGTST